MFGGESQAIAALFQKFRTSRLIAHTKRAPKHPHMLRSDVCGPRYMHPPMSSMFEKQFLSDDWLEFGSVAIDKAALSSQFRTSRLAQKHFIFTFSCQQMAQNQEKTRFCASCWQERREDFFFCCQLLAGNETKST